MEIICNLCNKKFKNNKTLTEHKINIHKINKINKKDKDDNSDKICRYCNKILSNRHSKWRHEQICKFNVAKIKKEYDTYYKEQIKKEIKSEIENENIKKWNEIYFKS